MAEICWPYWPKFSGSY